MQTPLFSPGHAHVVVRVALPVPVDSLFDYAVPREMAEHARPGHRALVPFSGRRLTGVIVETVAPGAPNPDLPARKLARIDRILDEEPVVSADMLAVLRKAARDCLCPVGQALSHALPPGASPRVVHHLQLTRKGRAALAGRVLDGAAHAALHALEGGALTPATIARRARGAPPPLRDLVRDGLLEKVQLEAGPSVREARERVACVARGLDVERICQDELARAPRQAELLRAIARSAEIPTRELAAGGRNPSASLRALSRRGFIELRERKVLSAVLGPAVERDREPSLTREQGEAFDRIASSVVAQRSDTFLLHGVTGSGKTEVYLRAVAEALRLGRQALVLVPEITLTHQIIARLRARFGDGLAILHSSLRPRERLEQWQRLRRGDVPIAVGARSALFAPIDRLGVVILDEEHDAAYKNEEGFRYHARDLALLRAQRARCPVVLGSATPALETRYAAERGEIQRLVLARRIGGRPLPAVELVDLQAERAKATRGRKLILTQPLRRALAETLRDGGQAILFLNRRGFSTQIYCFDCGFAERCKDCDVALVYHTEGGHTEGGHTEGRHTGGGQLLCHYCSFSKPPPAVCGGCGAADTALLGLGTQRVEEEVRSLFPDARLARMDRDTAQRRGHTESVLAALRSRDVDIVIGTQMVAKGHDFPGVQLVGVIAADLGLHLPDFRAAERTFQVLTQVAGRAGRADIPGRVVIQTFVPDHYAIHPVQDHDYESFYAQELAHRGELGYPPFARLCQVMISGADERQTREASEALAERARRDIARGGLRVAGSVELLGPAPAPLARLRGRYRYQLLVKGNEFETLERVARGLAEACAHLPKSLRASVDAHPGSML